jgi:uncharacterized membrane protein YuzA (DUF378 family)
MLHMSIQSIQIVYTAVLILICVHRRLLLKWIGQEAAWVQCCYIIVGMVVRYKHDHKHETDEKNKTVTRCL